MLLVSFVKFVGFLGLLRFLWWVFKILIAYFRKPVQLDRKKWVLITGASSGVGKSLSLKCARQGINAIGIGRNKETLESVAEEYAKINPSGTFRYILQDFSDPKAAANIFESLGEIELSSLFVCHGERIPKKLTDWTNEELINYNNAFMVSNVLLAKHFAAKTGQTGNITYISSVHNFTRLPLNQSYGSVKRFLNQFVHTYQFEAGDMHVQVLNPGRIDGTKFFDSVPNNLRGALARKVPGALTPERVADMVLATLNTNFDVDVGWDSIVSRVLFWVVPPPIIDFVLRRMNPITQND
jgi:short-subunit dehydrogenase